MDHLVVDKPYAQQADTLDAAVRYLERTGNADIIEILGLAGEQGPLVIDGQVCCPTCRFPYRGDGRKSCRRTKCPAGPTSRGAS